MGQPDRRRLYMQHQGQGGRGLQVPGLGEGLISRGHCSFKGLRGRQGWTGDSRVGAACSLDS